MKYIVFDLEFNQDPDSITETDLKTDHDLNILSNKKYPYEIIQIGAVKLDENLSVTDTFNRYVKPSIYGRISPHITELTGITSEMLKPEAPFKYVYKDFLEFAENKENILCVWGIIDIKTLYKNARYHNLDENMIPQKYINIQPYAAVYLGESRKRLLSLSYCARALGIEINSTFHDALHDAMYTAEIFKILYHSPIKPALFNPQAENKPQQPAKMVLDFSMLIAQFEKMFKREMTPEEKEIIRLAYHMGKTGQFLKKEDSPNK